MFLISGFYVVFYMMCDYGLYWLLEMFRRFFIKNIGVLGQYFYVMYLYVFKYFLNVKLFLNVNCYVIFMVDDYNLFYLLLLRL